MSGLADRLRAAFEQELLADPNDVRPLRQAVADAFGAATEVLADEIEDDQPEPTAPPVHDLPVKPGSVIVVTSIEGITTGLPLPGMHVGDGRWLVGECEYVDEDITGWNPARVEADEPGGWTPGDATDSLREVLRLARRYELGMYERLQAIEFAARNGLPDHEAVAEPERCTG